MSYHTIPQYYFGNRQANNSSTNTENFTTCYSWINHTSVEPAINEPLTTEQPASAQLPELTSLSKVPHITSEPVHGACTRFTPKEGHSSLLLPHTSTVEGRVWCSTLTWLFKQKVIMILQGQLRSTDRYYEFFFRHHLYVLRWMFLWLPKICSRIYFW